MARLLSPLDRSMLKFAGRFELEQGRPPRHGEIAAALGLTYSTARRHRARLFRLFNYRAFGIEWKCTECRKRYPDRDGVICSACDERIHEGFLRHQSAHEQAMEKKRLQAAKAYNDETWPGDPDRYRGTSLGKAV